MNFRGYIPFYKRNLKFAILVMLTQAGQITVQLADNIMVGHLGTAELAGVSFANSIIVLGPVFAALLFLWRFNKTTNQLIKSHNI